MRFKAGMTVNQYIHTMDLKQSFKEVTLVCEKLGELIAVLRFVQVMSTEDPGGWISYISATHNPFDYHINELCASAINAEHIIDGHIVIDVLPLDLQ